MTGQKLHGDEITMFSAEQIYYDVRGREYSSKKSVINASIFSVGAPGNDNL